MRNTTGASQSNEASESVEDDTRRDRPSNTYVAAVGVDRDPPSNTYVAAVGDTPSYSYVDCTLLGNPGRNDQVNSQKAEPAMEIQIDDEIKEAKGNQGAEGSLYSHLGQGIAENNVVVTNEDDQDYDLLDRSEKKNDPRDYGDEGAYQHIQTQVTPVDDDQDYQHLNRDEFR